MAESKIFGPISLAHVVLAGCLGSRGLPQCASLVDCFHNKNPEFRKFTATLRLDFEILL